LCTFPTSFHPPPAPKFQPLSLSLILSPGLTWEKTVVMKSICNVAVDIVQCRARIDTFGKRRQNANVKAIVTKGRMNIKTWCIWSLVLILSVFK
jgi:competence protein ComGC